MGNFGRGPYEEYECEILLNLGQQFKKRCPIKNFLFFALAAIMFRSGTVGAILVESIMRNI